MTYKAMPEQWAQCEEWVGNPVVGASDTCILELRSRVEALEVANTARTVEILCLTNAVANQVSDRAKLFADAMVDDDDHEPSPNSSQIGSSLVERVSAAIHPSICADPSLYLHEARAAIREVAAWLIDRRRYDDWLAPFEELAELLQEEAGQ